MTTIETEMSPEIKLQKAIYILENGDPDYNLVPGVFKETGTANYCVQGLLLELSEAGCWFDKYGDNFYMVNDTLASAPFLIDYYGLGSDKTKESNRILIDVNKLPTETQNDIKIIVSNLKPSIKRNVIDKGLDIITINNEGLRQCHPRTKQILADILRYKAFL